MQEDTLQNQIGEWATETFSATSTIAHKKFKTEVEEFNKAYDILHTLNQHRYFVDKDRLEEAYQAVEDEAADILFMLFQAAYFCDFDLIEATRKKFEINRNRTWERQPDGTFQHVKSVV